MSKTNAEHYYKNNSKTLRYDEELFQSGVNQLERQYNAIKEQRFNELVEENKKLNGAIQTYDILLKSNVEENQQLKERIDKAIEYLEEPNRDSFDYSKATLLDILKEVSE